MSNCTPIFIFINVSFNWRWHTIQYSYFVNVGPIFVSGNLFSDICSYIINNWNLPNLHLFSPTSLTIFVSYLISPLSIYIYCTLPGSCSWGKLREGSRKWCPHLPQTGGMSTRSSRRNINWLFAIDSSQYSW